jgi:hypothetical protein
MIDEHVGGRHDHKRALLSLIVYELWHGQFIQPSSAAFARRVESLWPDTATTGAA